MFDPRPELVMYVDLTKHVGADGLIRLLSSRSLEDEFLHLKNELRRAIGANVVIDRSTIRNSQVKIDTSVTPERIRMLAALSFANDLRSLQRTFVLILDHVSECDGETAQFLDTIIDQMAVLDTGVLIVALEAPNPAVDRLARANQNIPVDVEVYDNRLEIIEMPNFGQEEISDYAAHKRIVDPPLIEMVHRATRGIPGLVSLFLANYAATEALDA